MKVFCTLAAIASMVLVSSVSEAALIVTDADWANSVFVDSDGVGGSLDAVTDIAGDPGYQFTATAVASPGDPLGVGATGVAGYVAFATDIADVPGQVWEVQVFNPGTVDMWTQPIAWVDGLPDPVIGPFNTGGPLTVGRFETQVFDLSSFTTINKVGFRQYGADPAAGAAAGLTTSFTTTFQVVPEPTSLALVGLGGMAMMFLHRGKGKASA